MRRSWRRCRRAQLGQLAGRLDEEAHWSNILSGGEQQRLAVARALVFKPDWLFMDEATASLDEPAEAAIYGALKERLPGTTMVSIGHRPTLRQWHDRRLELRRARARSAAGRGHVIVRARRETRRRR